MADLTIDQGADFFVRFEVRDTTGSVVDLTNYTAKSEIRTSAGGALIGTFAATAGGALGYIDLVLGDITTDAMQTGSFVYDIFISNSTSGDIQKVGSGAVTVVPRITL